jgi:glucan endo-1,3-beta-D-glucosidase
MTNLLTLLLFSISLSHAAGIYTGFNYGAFWGEPSNVKKAADFQAGFGFAQNLTAAVLFNSARLFTCKEQNTPDTPTGAFDAAVETKTNLLLGIWITPAKKGDPLDDIIKSELSALGKGFEKHGQDLADLVIGLSVGSEDIYRSEGTNGAEVGVFATEVIAAIKTVKDSIASSTFAKYMQGKPIGHVDTAKYAVVDGADFYGITVYPYWNKDPVANAKESFSGTLEEIKQRAGNTPIWIAEVGWPFQGAAQGKAEASEQNLQQFWTDVGCTIVGKYTTFWFELIKDSEANQPDWGMIDPTTHQPRVDLSCPGMSPSGAPGASTSSPSTLSVAPPMIPSNSTTLVTLPSTSSPPAPSLPSSQPALESSVPAPPPAASDHSTIHVTVTLTSTVPPPAAPSPPAEDSSDTVTMTITSTIMVKPSSSSFQASTFISPANSSTVSPPNTASAPTIPSATLLPTSIPWCITVADIAWNGQLVPVAGNPAGSDGKCGTPSTMTAAPSASVLPSNIPWCLTVADIAWDGQFVPVAGNPAGPDGKCSPAPTYSGLPYGPSQPVVPGLPSATLNSTTSALEPSSTPAVISSVVPSSSTPQPAVPSASSSTLPAPPDISTPSSTPVLTPSSSAAGIAPTSAAPSVLTSSAATPPSGKSSILPSSSANLLINVASSQHPYCKRKLGSLAVSATPPASSAPAASSAPVVSSAATSSTPEAKLSSVSLPHFTFASGTPAAKKVVGAKYGQKRRWFGLW